MGDKQAPAPPNYEAAAREQAKTETQANRPNITTPYGSQQWTQDAAGNWSLSQGFDPRVTSALQQMQGFDWGQFGDIGTGEDARNAATKAYYERAASRLDPRFARQGEELRTRLGNQGLDEYSPQARAARMELEQSKADAYGGAEREAQLAGQGAGESIFRQNMQRRQQALAEALRKRGAPLEDMQQAMGLLGTPGFATSRGPDLFGASTARGNAEMQRFLNEQQSQADIAGGGAQALAGLLPLLFMLSDARAKEAVRLLPVEAMPGVPWVVFRYRPGLGPPGVHVGVLAQDIQRVRPDLVRERRDGLLEVDYSFAWRQA